MAVQMAVFFRPARINNLARSHQIAAMTIQENKQNLQSLLTYCLHHSIKYFLQQNIIGHNKTSTNSWHESVKQEARGHVSAVVLLPSYLRCLLQRVQVRHSVLLSGTTSYPKKANKYNVLHINDSPMY